MDFAVAVVLKKFSYRSIRTQKRVVLRAGTLVALHKRFGYIRVAQDYVCVDKHVCAIISLEELMTCPTQPIRKRR